VLVSGRSRFAWYSKSGAYIAEQPAETLFSGAVLSLSGDGCAVRTYNDARALYDTYRQRFWVVVQTHCTDTPPGSTTIWPKARGRLLIGVSKTEFPEDGFYQYYVEASPTLGASHVLDYPRIGIDGEAFYTTYAVWSKVKSGAQQGVLLFNPILIQSATDMASGQLAVRTRLYDKWFQPSGCVQMSALQPATHYGPTSQGFFVSHYDTEADCSYNRNATHNRVLVWSVVNPFSATPTVRRSQVTMTPFDIATDTMPQKPAPSGVTPLLNNPIAWEPTNVVWQNNKLYFANTDKALCNGVSFNAGRVNRLDTSSFPTSVGVDIQRIFSCGSIGDTVSYHHTFPAVGVNSAGDIALLTTRAGSTIFPELRSGAFLASETDIRSSVPAKVGEATYIGGGGAVENWNDTVQSSQDPFDPSGIWLISQYARTGGQVNMWVSKMFGNKYPDMYAGGVAAPLTLPRGVARTITVTYANRGDGVAPAMNHSVYLSADETISSAGDVRVGTFTTGTLNPASGTAMQSQSVTIVVPTTVTPGTYYLGSYLNTGNLTEYSFGDSQNGPAPVMARPFRVTVN